MDIRSIRLKNFTSYVDEFVDLTGIRLACLVGANGAGKSSLLPDSVLYCLFGRTERSASVDDLVRKGQTDMEVSVEFELAGQIYRVTRARSLKGRGRSALVLEEFSDGAWQDISEKDIADTQRKIEEIVGASYETLCFSVFAQQGQYDAFTSSRPATRKDVLAEILGLDMWKLCEEEARERLRGVRVDLEALSRERQELEAALAREDELLLEEKELADSARWLEEREREIAGRLSALTSELSLAQAREEARRAALERKKKAEQSLAEAKNEVAALEEKVKLLEDELSRRESLEAAAREYAILKPRLEEMESLLLRRAALEKEYLAAAAELKKAESERDSLAAKLESELAHLEHQAALLDEVSCDGSGRCEFLKEANEAKSRLPSVRAELSELRKRRFPELEERVKLAESELMKINVSQEEVQELRSKVKRLESLAAAFERLAGLEERLSEHRVLLEAARTRAARLEEEILGMEVPPPQDLEAIRRQVKEAEGELERVRAHLAAARERLGAARQKIASLQDAKKRHREVLELLDAARRKQYVLQTLVKAFSRDGVPAMVMGSVVPEIEVHANNFLNVLQAGRMKVKLVTEVETKSGVREGLEVYVLAGGLARPYSTFSGAEKFSVDLALRMALAVVLSRRWGKPVETLVIDEGAGSLDPVGRENLVKALEIAARHFKRVIFTTHLEELQDAFPAKLLVEKTEQGSKVRLCA